MCMATAFWKKGGDTGIIIKDLAFVSSKGGKLILKSLFGEEKTISATIKEIDFLNSTVLFDSGEMEREE